VAAGIERSATMYTPKVSQASSRALSVGSIDMTRTTVVICCWTSLLGFGSQAVAQGNPLRDAYFGETHVHTSYSLDAWTFGNRITDPGDAYKYFKGESIKHPLGYDIKIDTPLDFAGVTDHSEYVGVTRLANDPNSPINKLPAAQPLILRNNSQEEVQKVYLYVVKLVGGSAPVKALLSPEITHTVWEKNNDSRTRLMSRASSLPSVRMSGRPCPTT
jgi:hypothetical protein